MSYGKNIVGLSPLPIVEVSNPNVPKDGIMLAACSLCYRKFNRDKKCRDFYVRIDEDGKEGFFSCPYGLTAYVFRIDGVPYSFSGLIVAPRLNGPGEIEQARNHPEMKISQEKVLEMAKVLKKLSDEIHVAVIDGLKVGLHEIRKFNRTIKQEAERLCISESPSDPHHANSSTVRIWKTAELMSQQFEVLEFLGDESLFQLPRKTRSEVYRALDKCVRIQEVFAKERGLKLHLVGHQVSPFALVCDKTFPLLPTVLIDNAIKYAPSASTVNVRLDKLNKNVWEVSVENLAKPTVMGISELFKKGIRGHKNTEGTGVGLYLAQKAAEQHGTKIELNVAPAVQGLSSYRFSFRLEGIP